MSRDESQIGSIPVVTILDQYTLKIKLKREDSLTTGAPTFKEEEYAYDACFGDNAS